MLSLHCCAWAFSSFGKLGLLARCGAWASHCDGFFCGGAWALRCAGFRSCDTRAGLVQGMWFLPGPGIEPMPPALPGGFLSSVLPRKSRRHS